MGENGDNNLASSRFWSNLKEAIQGSQRDFTEGSIGLAIFLLAVPMILEMLMESVFAIVDVYFVSSLGAEAIAVVGITESLMVLIYGVAMGLSIGISAMVSRRIGEKDPNRAANAVTHAIYLGIVCSATIALIGVIFTPNIFRLMGAEQSVIDEGTTFMRIMFGSNFVIVFLFLLNAVFRGAGDAAIAMRVLIIANTLNCFLDPMFIFGFLFIPELGVTGAAIATSIGRGIGVLYALYSLFFRDQRLIFRRKNWRFNPRLLKRLWSISWLATIQMLISTASWVGIMTIVASFGSKAVAGYTIALRIIVFALLPSLGLGNAAATLVGQNLGAGRPNRAEKSVWRAALINSIFLSFIGLILIIFSDEWVAIFSTEQAVLNLGSDALRIISYGFFFYGIGMVVETSFNGAGDAVTPTVLNIFIFWLFEIPLAYILSNYTAVGVNGSFWAITTAFTVLTIVSALIFKQGRWKLKTV